MYYMPMRDGLKKCLQEFLQSDRRFRHISYKSEAYMDWLTDSRTELSRFPSVKEKIKYCVERYTPYFAIVQKRLK